MDSIVIADMVVILVDDLIKWKKSEEKMKKINYRHPLLLLFSFFSVQTTAFSTETGIIHIENKNCKNVIGGPVGLVISSTAVGCGPVEGKKILIDKKIDIPQNNTATVELVTRYKQLNADYTCSYWVIPHFKIEGSPATIDPHRDVVCYEQSDREALGIPAYKCKCFNK